MSLTGTRIALSSDINTSSTSGTYTTNDVIADGTQATVYLRNSTRSAEQWMDVTFDIANHFNINILAKNKVDGTLDTTQQQVWGKGTIGEITLHGANRVRKDQDNTFSGDFTFTGTNKQGLVYKSLTTIERDALAISTNGAMIYNTTDNVPNMKIAGTWLNPFTAATILDAADGIGGKVDLASPSEIAAHTIIDAISGSENVIPVSSTTITSAGAGDSGKVPALDSAGLISDTMINTDIARLTDLSGITPAQGTTLTGGGNASSLHNHGTNVIASSNISQVLTSSQTFTQNIGFTATVIEINYHLLGSNTFGSTNFSTGIAKFNSTILKSGITWQNNTSSTVAVIPTIGVPNLTAGTGNQFIITMSISNITSTTFDIVFTVTNGGSGNQAFFSINYLAYA